MTKSGTDPGMHMKLRLFLAVVLAASGVQAASAQSRNHETSIEGIVVEHAEIIPGPSTGEGTRGYLTVWNGNRTRAALLAVESDDYAKISVHQSIYDNGAVATVPVPGGLIIPGHSELILKPDGVHLLLENPTRELPAGQAVTLTLRFADGITVVATADVLAPGTALTDHHHGEGDGPGID